MYRKLLLGFGALVAAVALFGTAVEAAIVTVPTGLSPGAKYRLVFVTSTKRDGPFRVFRVFSHWPMGTRHTLKAV